MSNHDPSNKHPAEHAPARAAAKKKETAHKEAPQKERATKLTAAHRKSEHIDVEAETVPSAALTDDGAAAEDLGEQKVELTPAQQATATRALEATRGRALKLRTSEILVYRLSPPIIMVNVRLGKGALSPHRAELEKALPMLDFSNFDALEQTSLALAAAANDAEKSTGNGLMLDNIKRARAIRGRLLPALQSLALNGLVPMQTYEDIAAGTGVRDTAKDCLDLTAAFRKYDSQIRGKHPISDADLVASEEIGSWLLLNLSTKGARTEKGAVSPVIELRNRIATLMVQDYAQAEIMGHYIFGENYADFVPPLRSRRVARSVTAAPSPAPTPSPSSPITAPTAAPAPAPAPVAAGGNAGDATNNVAAPTPPVLPPRAPIGAAVLARPAR